jgi:hypothetical protein
VYELTDGDDTEALAKKRGSKQPRPQKRVVALSLPEIREASLHVQDAHAPCVQSPSVSSRTRGLRPRSHASARLGLPPPRRPAHFRVWAGRFAPADSPWLAKGFGGSRSTGPEGRKPKKTHRKAQFPAGFVFSPMIENSMGFAGPDAAKIRACPSRPAVSGDSLNPALCSVLLLNRTVIPYAFIPYGSCRISTLHGDHMSTSNVLRP